MTGQQDSLLERGAGSASSVGIVIVHRNAGERCVATIARFLDQGLRCDITVVDNDSRPAELDQIRTKFPDVHVIETRANLGYGPGLNVGARHWLRHGTGEWLVLSPHDALLEAGGLERLISLGAADPRRGLLCADVGDQATPEIDPFLGALPGPSTVRQGWQPAAYPHGTLIMIRRACLAEIGCFDERYFAYNDEADLGLRASKAGWDVGLARDVMVENPSTSTSAEIIDYLRLRNTILLLRTHYGWRQGAFRVAVAVGNVAHCTVRPSARAPWYSGRARLRGVRDAVLRRWGGPPDDVIATT